MFDRSQIRIGKIPGSCVFGVFQICTLSEGSVVSSTGLIVTSSRKGRKKRNYNIQPGTNVANVIYFTFKFTEMIFQNIYDVETMDLVTIHLATYRL